MQPRLVGLANLMTCSIYVIFFQMSFDVYLMTLISYVFLVVLAQVGADVAGEGDKRSNGPYEQEKLPPHDWLLV